MQDFNLIPEIWGFEDLNGEDSGHECATYKEAYNRAVYYVSGLYEEDIKDGGVCSLYTGDKLITFLGWNKDGECTLSYPKWVEPYEYETEDLFGHFEYGLV